jgi:hypothetical protein
MNTIATSSGLDLASSVSRAPKETCLGLTPFPLTLGKAYRGWTAEDKLKFVNMLKPWPTTIWRFRLR